MGSVVSKPDRLPVESLLLDVADVLATSLDLDTTLRRVAEVVRKVIDYEIFAILLLNEKTQELRFRFQTGHAAEFTDRARIKVGEGVTGLAAQSRQAILIEDVRTDPRYIEAVPNVCSELAIPLITKNRVIGVIDLEAREPGYFTEEHRRVLTLVASRMAAGIENAQLYTRTTKQARILLLLNEIARELTSILNLDELLGRIAELVRRLIDYQMFSILLLDSSGEMLQHRFSLRFNENIHLKHEIPLGRGIVGAAAQSREAVLVPDVTKDPRYVQANPETRSELAVPLIYKNKVVGVLDLEHTRRGFFTDDHKRTMTTLAAQIAIALENARLYEEIERQERRLERDLSLARELQGRLLPQTNPKLAHLDVAAKFVPARAIGGDLYDFIPYSMSRLGIVIGDVSGKGAPAAIYAALVSGILRSHAPIEPAPAEMLSAVNLSLAERRIEAQFVSIIYAVWDDAQRTLTVANSGLPRPIYVHNGKNEAIEATGLPLGLFDEAEYDEFTFRMKPGDMFVFFSDGILDARNREGELFSRKQVEDVISGCAEQSANCVVESLFKAVAEHSAGVETFDDQTVVAIRVRGTSQTAPKKEMTVPSQTLAERPPGFIYREKRNGQAVLHCEGVPLSKLADKYGTPLYVYSAATINIRYASFDGAFREIPHTICYSVKANSNQSILRLLAKKGCGFDVVSGGELERVLIADRKAAKKVVFSGVGKTREELIAALKAGILLFNVESESELAVLADCAAGLRKAASIALRVNPDVAAETHPYISTGLHKHKFGVPIGEARRLYANAATSKYLSARGVSVHIGSQITDATPFGEAMSRVADLVRELRGQGHRIEYVDAGGGLGISYDKSDSADFPDRVNTYARQLATPLRNLNIHLLLEPGRSIIGPAGILLTKVVYKKSNNGKRFLIVDAAMNDLIRPALYGAHHEIVPVVQTAAANTETTDIVGPVCETGDFFARDRALPEVTEGDLLAILDSGAYGMVLASNYNTRPRPAEVLVSGKSTKIVRRREKVSDLLRAEL